MIRISKHHLSSSRSTVYYCSMFLGYLWCIRRGVCRNRNCHRTRSGAEVAIKASSMSTLTKETWIRGEIHGSKNKLQENSWYRATGATLNNWGEISGSPFLADHQKPWKKTTPCSWTLAKLWVTEWLAAQLAVAVRKENMFWPVKWLHRRSLSLSSLLFPWNTIEIWRHPPFVELDIHESPKHCYSQVVLQKSL